MSRLERQQKASTTRVLRFEKDKDADSRSTPDHNKSPFYSAAVGAASHEGGGGGVVVVVCVCLGGAK